ncbi:2-oxo acid dehydrogenase subunit E2 [Actinoplanes sp. CA-051413]|uniref:2-oxo acid dehydrogenase subunit E2 n=1 Tax=Actinoplanes sp. CA-051413 TaxID=3239899 RepID=UPI003D98BD74
MRPAALAPQRRHTYYFLREIRQFSPVFLDTDIDMTAVQRHRREARERSLRYSTVSYVLHTASRVLALHPDANAAISGRVRPRLAYHDRVHAKLALDRDLGGRRVVLAAVLPDLHLADLDGVQRQVSHYRDGDAADMPEFAGVRALHRLPALLGAFAFRRTVRPLRNRAERVGTFAVTSLGHRPVQSFHSVGGTTITLGLGQVSDRPVVRDGVLAVAPLMRLSLSFDHRVIDGAEAADVLTEIKDGLEAYGE